MSGCSRIRVAGYLSLALGLLLAACQPAPAAAPIVVPTDTPVAVVQVAASPVPSATDTPIPIPTTAPTATAVPPTNTPLPTATASPTIAPTNTPTAVPPTATARPTLKPTAKPTSRPLPTNPPATETKAPAPAGGDLYSTFVGGPQGYVSILGCTHAGGAPCQSVMAPGDVAFSIRLVALDYAVPAIFVPFGLAVEKNGANVADMYMTVVSGWLNPGEYADLGTSRNFTQPGHYVIRTNGCYVTRETYPNCNWGTVDGTVVTFDIQ